METDAREGMAPATAAMGRLLVDERSHRVWLDGREIEISPTEWLLLLALVRADGAVVTAAELFQAAWGHERVDRHLLEVNLSRLRAKLHEPAHGGLIRTVRSFGYALEAPLVAQ